VDQATIAVWGLFLTFLGTLANQYFTGRREKSQWERQRQDALEKRKWEAEDRAVAAQLLAQSTREAKLHAETIVSKITENTTLTHQAIEGAKEAFKEANAVNQKIAILGVALDANQQPVDRRTVPEGSTTPIDLRKL
jgi:hypothetical protein